jgi:class 3 adenylate cyclase
MEQEIRFCTTSDGVSIAYATLGSGPPLVYANGWPGNLATEWEQGFVREFLETFASAFTLVRYDMRNSGLSGAAGDDMALDSLVTDLDAVADALQLEQFPLMSLGLLGAPVAVTYAARHSDRVSRIAALSPFVAGNRLMNDAQYKAMSSYVAAFGRLVTPDTFRDPERHGVDPKKMGAAGSIHERSAPPEIVARLLETLFRADLGDALDRLEMPVLVMHGSGDGTVSLEVSREFAARLKTARFVPYDGAGAAPWADTARILPELFEFFGAPPPRLAAGVRPAPAGSMATILFTDITSSTALTQQIGDAKAHELVREHNDIVRQALTAHGGTEIKHTGDGIMASFSTASAALECAISIQRGIDKESEEMHGHPPFQVHVGLNAGEPVAEGGDLYGTAVQLARRICDQAPAGEILVSNVVRELAAGKGFLFAETGETALKGFEEPVRLYQLRWRDGPV